MPDGATLSYLLKQGRRQQTQKGYIMEQNEINKKLNDHTMDTLDLIKQLFNMIKQQREYNLLQDQLIEGLQNRVKKLEGRSK